MRNAIFLSAVLTLPIYPQIVSVGAVAGTNITNDVSSLGGGGRNTIPGATQTLLTDPGGRRLIIGLKLELRLPQNWGIEVNALHRKVQLTTTTIFSPPISRPDGSQFSILGPFTTTLTSWEFPVLAKYRLPIPKLQPFLTAGPSFRPGGTSLSQIGVTAGGGVAFQTGSLHIDPTLRYTRWSASNRYPIGGPNVNQVELLVGLDSPSREQGVRAFGRPLSVGLIAGVGRERISRPGTVSLPFRNPTAAYTASCSKWHYPRTLRSREMGSTALCTDLRSKAVRECSSRISPGSFRFC